MTDVQLGGPAVTDEELVARSKQGSDPAFTELVGRYRDRAVKLACTVVGNFEDAKDVSQEAFVKAYNALKGFEGRSKFSTWFFRILMNQSRDFLRSRRWKRFISFRRQEAMENFFEALPERGVTLGARVLGEELGCKMTQAIAGLPFKQGWVFQLRFLEGLALAEIGEVTGMAEGTVKANLHFAVQKFRKFLGPYLEEERGTP
jgi:RNA polymerase sigma-70 factor (ECF subfamily)